MNCTAHQLIKAALRSIADLGVGREPSTSEVADALFALNRMIDAWNIDPLAVFTRRIDAYTLTPSKQSYTIAQGLHADFEAPRPTEIETANLILNSQDPPLRRPIEILNDQQWASIKLQGVHSSIPLRLYYDGGFPIATIFLWPYPDQAFQLELYTWQQLTEFTAATDHVNLPQGYADAIALNLAVMLAPEWNMQLRPDVASRAALALGAVRAHNAPSPLMDCDSAVLGGGRRSGFNRLTGDLF